MFEMARQNISDEIREKASDAKLAYDAAYARFNSAQNDAMAALAVYDMNAAMKRYCYIVEALKKKQGNGA